MTRTRWLLPKLRNPMENPIQELNASPELGLSGEMRNCIKAKGENVKEEY